MYSFEDIVTTNGIEDANIEGKENLDNLYRRHLGPKVITQEQLEQAKSSTNAQYPKYTKKQLLENTIDRNISELSESVEFVPEMIRVDRLLTSFDNDKKGVRVVVDEFGGFVGLIGAEAVLAVLAGWWRKSSP